MMFVVFGLGAWFFEQALDLFLSANMRMDFLGPVTPPLSRSKTTKCLKPTQHTGICFAKLPPLAKLQGMVRRESRVKEFCAELVGPLNFNFLPQVPPKQPISKLTNVVCGLIGRRWWCKHVHGYYTVFSFIYIALYILSCLPRFIRVRGINVFTDSPVYGMLQLEFSPLPKRRGKNEKGLTVFDFTKFCSAKRDKWLRHMSMHVEHPQRLESNVNSETQNPQKRIHAQRSSVCEHMFGCPRCPASAASRDLDCL